MLVRKNTKEFNAIRNILETYAGEAARRKHIRLFVVKAGETLHNRLPIDELGDEASFYYDLNYSTILSNLRSSDHRLHRSKVPGLYYFRNPHFPQWEQTPFQLTKALMDRLDEFEAKPRARGKAQRAIDDLPEDAAVFAGDGNTQRKPKSEAPRKKGKARKKAAPKKEKVKKEKPSELVMGEKHKLHFTEPDRKVFSGGNYTLEDVVNYYDAMSRLILPHMHNRPMAFRIGDRNDDFVRSIESLKEKNIVPPRWMKQVKDTSAAGGHKHYLVCHDKDHLLYALQQGCVELHPQLRHTGNLQHPDYFVINLRPSNWFNDVVEVAQAVREVLEGSFDSYIKLSEHKGFHIYVPWKEQVSWKLSWDIANMIARQVQALAPRLCSVSEKEAKKEEKVFIDVSVNDDKTRTLIAPYSLIQNSNGLVAAPLKWDEVTRKLDPEAFNIRTMQERAEEIGDVFEGMLK